MPRASTYTLLSLSRYAQLMGLDPLHFSGAYSSLRPRDVCDRIWYQHDWQHPKRISREQLARRIAEAEQDLADYLGYWPGPVWIVDERQPYPRPRQRELTGYGYDIRWRHKRMKLNWGYVIEAGQCAAELLDSGTTYTTIDADNDGFNETAVFTIAGVSSSLDTTEVHAYFKEYDVGDLVNTRTDPSSSGADQAWEVRPIRCSLSGTTLTVYIYVWELFRPVLQETLEMDADEDGAPPIDADSATSYVDALDFYRLYTDPETQVQFLWGSDIPCTSGSSLAGAVATQTGCFRIQDERRSIVVPSPATYSAADEAFIEASWTQGIEPDAVRFWYRSGNVDPRSGYSTLTDYWARIIAQLATARLEWPLCDCTNVKLVTDRWQEDRAMITDQRSFSVSTTDLDNPFGTRTGEVEAWKALRRRAIGQAVIT